jgi:serine/threonine protein phosphatase 1
LNTLHSYNSITRDSKLYPLRLLAHRVIFIGHTPTVKYDIFIPMNGAKLWNVDTGAAFNGSLTIMDVDSKKYWQSERLPLLYSGEKGRN